MPFRRRSVAQEQVHRAAATACEPLEPRRLLTALIDGRFQGTGTAFDGTSVFEYRQGDNDPVRISVSGNISAEFIGASYNGGIDANGNPSPSELTLSDLVPITVAQSAVWLFSIYVVKADMNCTISIASVPDPNAAARPMQPFNGASAVRFSNATSGASTVGNSTEGGVWIGARTPQNLPNPTNNIPLIWADQRAFGMRPSSAGEMFAGLEVAPGSDLGRFFLGGAISGLVDVPGSMETFYASSILTGDASGIPRSANSQVPGFTTGFPLIGNSAHFPKRNFRVGGDLRNLLALNSFGTLTLAGPVNLVNSVYKTGFQLDVGGRVGQVHAADSFLGQAYVHNDARIRGPGIAQREVEYRGGTLAGSTSYFDPTFFGNDISIGQYTNDARFDNDTFETAQFLGTAWSQALNSEEVVQLTGALRNNGFAGQGGTDDNADYYAVPLLAGQTMEVTLTDDFVGVATGFRVRLGIFDPDGRLIASDYTNGVQNETRIYKTIKITADRPGSYRIAVGDSGDFNFNGAVDDGEGVNSLSPHAYELRVRKIADIGFGGLTADTHMAFTDVDTLTLAPDRSVQVDRGDMGEIRAGIVGGGTLWSFLASPVYIPAGNLRAVEASNIGVVQDGTGVISGSSGLDFLVRKGSLGLLRNTAAGGVLCVNDDVGQTVLYPASGNDLRLTPKQLAVGGDIQLVDAAGDLNGALLANGGIGVIRAASVHNLASTSNPVWQANVDRSGSDGTIDLIDVVGSMISPAITAGPNGNVRYIRAGGGFTRDTFFGGGDPAPTLYTAGTKARINDDSGTQIVLTPLPLDRRTFPLPGQPPFNDPPTLSVLTYGIRYSGGSVITNVTVATTDDTIAPLGNGGGGLLVETGTSGPLGTAEISQINIGGPAVNANTIAFDPFNRVYVVTPVLPTVTTTVRTLDLNFQGGSAIDVFEIIAPATAVFDSITNNTGEIVNITGSPDIILLEADSLGLAKSNTATIVEGATIQNNTYPFLQQRNLVQVGDLNSASTRRGMGNIVATNINTLRANSDRKNVAGVFEGINGPIVSLGLANQLTGNIVSVSTGEGIASSGSGLVGFAGLYADGAIDVVSGSGDIRGDIVANQLIFVTQQVTNDLGVPQFDRFGQPILESTPSFGIGNIRLSGGGNISGSDILVVNTDPAAGPAFAQATEGNNTFNLTDRPDDFTTPLPDIQSIRIDGTGGIIGSVIAAQDMGLIQINGGFGIVTTRVATGGDGQARGVVTDGYGIRDCLFDGGAEIVTLDARGTGKRVATTSYSPGVRYSEKSRFDPNTGQSLDILNDLHLYLGTSAKSPKRKGLSDTGIIEDSQFLGSRTIRRIDAQRIIARDTFVIDAAGTQVPVTQGNEAYPMRISFPDSIGTINVRDFIDGLGLVGGGLEALSVKNDMLNTRLDLNGRVKSISAGALRGSSQINVEGPEGQVDSITTRRSLYSRINVAQDIKSVSVGTDLGSPFLHTSRHLRSITIKGSILSGARLDVRKTLFNLNVGGDIQANATVRANNIVTQTIGGEVIGDIVIA